MRILGENPIMQKQILILMLNLILLLTTPAFSQEKKLKLVIQTGHSGAVKSVAYSPDGKLLATAGSDADSNVIKLWDAESGKEVKTLFLDSRVESVAFSPDGKKLVSGSWGDKIRLWNVETGQEIKTLGEFGYVQSVTFSPDGKQIASGTTTWNQNKNKYTFTIYIWDVASGKKNMSLDGHAYAVQSVTFSRDGKQIVSGSGDSTVKLWNLETGREIKTFKGHLLPIYSVAISADGSRIASSSSDGAIKLWNVNTGKEIKTLEEQSPNTNINAGAVTFSPDDKYIAGGTFTVDSTINLWDAMTGKRTRVLKGHSSYIISTAYSPDGKMLVSGSNDNTIKLWDVETGEEIKTLTNHVDGVVDVKFSPSGKQIISGSRDKTIKSWDVETGKEIRTFKIDSSFVGSFAFSNDGNLIAGGSVDENDKTSWKVKLWDAKSGKEIKKLKVNSEVIFSVAFSPDSRLISCGSTSRDKNGKFTGMVHIWDVETGKKIKTLAGHSNTVTSIAFSPNGKQIVSGSRDNTVKLWNVGSGKEIKTLTGHSKWVESVIFSHDGGQIVSGSLDKTIMVWDIETDSEPKTFKEVKTGRAIAISPNGKQIATGGWHYNSLIKLWDVKTSKELKTFAGHEASINSIAFGPNGRQLVSAGSDTTVKFFDIETGKLAKTLTNHAKNVLGATFSPDGKQITLASADRTIKMWGLTTNQQPKILKGHSNEVNSAFYSPDGKLIASASDDGTIKLWNSVTGQTIKTLRGHSNHVWKAIFSSDGKMLGSISSDNSIKLWDVATGKQIKTFTNNSSQITSFAFSPDGKQIAGGSVTQNKNSKKYIGTIHIWDVETGQEVKTLGNLGYVQSITFSPDGKKISGGSATWDENSKEYFGTIHIWDVETGQEIKSFKGHMGEIRALRFSADGRILFSGSNDKTIKKWDVTTGKELATLKGHSDEVYRLLLSPDGKLILSVGLDKTFRIWDIETGNLLATMLNLDEDDWVVIDSEGRFDASENAQKLMHYTYGLEVIDFEQLKEAYYEPGLLQKLLGFSKDPLRQIVPLKDIKLYPEIIEKSFDSDSKKLTIKLKTRGIGIGKTRVLVNGKLAIADARTDELKKNPEVPAEEIVTLTADLNGSSIREGEENKITVITSNYLKEIGKGNIQSRGADVVYLDKGKKEDRLPSLYAVVGGVSDYDGEAIDLSFASKDAEDFSNALSIGAKKLFCDKEKPNCLDKVQITTLSTSGNEGTIQPTKENFKKAFAEIAKKAKPDDIIVIYLAGHGVSLGTNTDTYFYLTKEARSASKEDLAKNFQTVAISSEELAKWLTLEEWVAGEKGIKALKQVLILDTCAAGTAATQLALIAKRDLSSDQIRAIEFLKDKTGTFVLMGSSADAPSYEASQFGQGLLTRSLLEGMKGAALDKEFINVQKLFGYAQTQVPRLAVNVGGVQQPIISAPRGKNFVIGQMTEAEMRRINLPSKKPFISRPSLTMQPINNDPLRLTAEMRKRFEEESSYEVVQRRSGGSNENKDTILVYVDDESFPDAVRVTGSYIIEGETIKIQAYLIKNEKVLTKLPEIVAGKEKVLDDLMVIIRKEISKLPSD